MKLVKRSLLLVVFLVGCHTCPVAPTPIQRQANAVRPEDMTDRILPDPRFPPWLKRSYAEWIRYAYDCEPPGY
jgi:hypothetical protein